MTSRARTLTLRRAIVLTVAFGLLLPALLISGYSWFKRYHEDIREQTEELSQQYADVVASGMQEPLWNVNHDSGNALLSALLSRNEDIVRIEARGDALGVFVSGEHPERRAGFTAVATRPVLHHGDSIGSVQVEVGSIRLRNNMIEELTESAIALAAQAALSIVLILVLLDRRLVRPLQRLGAGTERLAARRLDEPFTWGRLDEIGLLSRRMEDTRISLNKLFEELDGKNHELELDIRKRERIEQELYEREERFRILVEQSPIAIIEWNNRHEAIEWNAAAEKMFGYTRAQAVGRHASFLIPEGDREQADDALRRLIAGPGESRIVLENRKADGRLIVCQWSCTHIMDEAGRLNRLLSIAEDITEKRRASQALSLSEAKFAGAFECNPDSAAIVRMSDSVIIDVNQTFEEMTGYRRDEAVGRTSDDLRIWVRPEERAALYRELQGGRPVRNFAWEMRTRPGIPRRCITNCTVFNAGNERYMFAVIRDVTDQRLLEEQKAEADRALRRLARGTRDIGGAAFFELLVADLAAALRTDCAFIGLRMPAAQNRIRTIAAHVRGHAVENFDYASAGTPSERTLEGEVCIFASGVQSRFPADMQLAEYGWDSYAGSPLRDAAGNAIGVLAVLHTQPLGNPDLVKSLLQVFSERASAELERKRAEEELRASEQRFSTIFQSSPIAMFVTQMHSDYVVKDVNRAFEQLFLLSRESVFGKNTAELGLYCDPADRAALIAELRRADAAAGRPEIWMRRGDGSAALVQVCGHAFMLAGERFGIIACTDVTDKHRIENEIRELNATLEQRVDERTDELQRANTELEHALDTLNKAQEELVRSEKLAALGSLVAGIAHELNTPIGNSLMVASALHDQTREIAADYASDGGIRRSALERHIGDTGKAGDILVRNLQRAADLVASFRQVAVDQTSSQRRAFLVAEVVSEIMLTLWPTFRKTSIEVQQDIAGHLKMDSYPGPLGQVITNLVNNALQHAFEGRHPGHIWISARAASEKGWMELIVRDDGAGIAPAHINRVFDPFFTTRLGSGGSGLGLNIAHNIVTGVLGGRIAVQSEPGRGSAFILDLPLTAPNRQADDGPPQA